MGNYSAGNYKKNKPRHHLTMLASVVDSFFFFFFITVFISTFSRMKTAAIVWDKESSNFDRSDSINF